MHVCAAVHEPHVQLLILLLLFGDIQSLLEHGYHHFVTGEHPREGDAFPVEVAAEVRFDLGHLCLGLEGGMDAPDELLCEFHVRFDGLKEQVVGADSQVVGDLRGQVTCRSIC